MTNANAHSLWAAVNRKKEKEKKECSTGAHLQSSLGFLDAHVRVHVLEHS